MNLKPTKYKIIISVVITLIWYIFLFYFNANMICFCAVEGFKDCTDYNFLSPLQGGCHCDCISLPTVLYLYFISFIVPFFIAYFIISLAEKESVKE